MLLPTSKQFPGYIARPTTPRDLIRMHQKACFIFHSRGLHLLEKIPSPPSAQRRAMGLLHKHIVKTSAMSRQASPITLVTDAQKPGENSEQWNGAAD